MVEKSVCLSSCNLQFSQKIADHFILRGAIFEFYFNFAIGYETNIACPGI